MSELLTKKSVSFSVYPEALYGDVFKDVMIRSKVDMEDAITLRHDVLAAFNNAKPYLPVEAVGKVEDETWLIVQFKNKTEVVVGASWVKPESVVYSTNSKLVLTIDNAGWDTLPIAKAALAARGIKISASGVTY